MIFAIIKIITANQLTNQYEQNLLLQFIKADISFLVFASFVYKENSTYTSVLHKAENQSLVYF